MQKATDILDNMPKTYSTNIPIVNKGKSVTDYIRIRRGKRVRKKWEREEGWERGKKCKGISIIDEKGVIGKPPSGGISLVCGIEQRSFSADTHTNGLHVLSYACLLPCSMLSVGTIQVKDSIQSSKSKQHIVHSCCKWKIESELNRSNHPTSKNLVKVTLSVAYDLSNHWS